MYEIWDIYIYKIFINSVKTYKNTKYACFQCDKQIKTEVLYIFSLPIILRHARQIVCRHIRSFGYIYFGNRRVTNTTGIKKDILTTCRYKIQYII